MNASLARAVLTLLEGLERRAAGEAWPALEEQASFTREALHAALRASGEDRFGVDRAALSAVRIALAARERDARAAAHLLFAVVSLPAVHAFAGRHGVVVPVSTHLSSDEFAAARAAACEAYDELSSASLPDAGAGTSLLTALNPHAGVHPLPADLRVIAVAIEAGQRSFDAFAYYDLRYGDRGRAFTRTDSAWLAAIAEQGVDVTRQVVWLARVLASRGMPSLLLERHLDGLSAALAREFPGRVMAYESLRAAAERLRRGRLTALPYAEGTRAELSRELSAIPDNERAVAISPEEAATLVVAALADDAASHLRGSEASGRVGAAASLRAWLADEGRFSKAWCVAVERALDARAAGTPD